MFLLLFVQFPEALFVLNSFSQYGILTGVYPFYDECHESKVKEFVKEGRKPYIDPKWAERSYAEGELAKVVESCWAYEPSDRPSITDLIHKLREVVDENKRLGQQAL